ncbi:hypothetical protein A9Q83_08200 [Alphaproteobacteria bacterium 46_93_T64]|nr:hypothetical protein A9Q83_08200 [Alphaproteobacteria bacterium 46_93_T64]
MSEIGIKIAHGARILPSNQGRNSRGILHVWGGFIDNIGRPFSTKRFLSNVQEARAEIKIMSISRVKEKIRTILSEKNASDFYTKAVLYGTISAYIPFLYGTTFSKEDDRCAWALLNNGVSEYCGEGEIIMAIVIAAVFALEGQTTHVICKDDLRAKTVFVKSGKLLEALDIKAGLVDRKTGSAKRGVLYSRKIVFVPAAEIIMDYLREQAEIKGAQNDLRILFRKLAGKYISGTKPIVGRLSQAILLDGEELLCGLTLTSIMVNERTPVTVEANIPYEALGLAWQLQKELDFRIVEFDARFTRRGLERLAILTGAMGARWANPSRSEHLVRRALEVLYIWQLDRDYSIEDDELVFKNSVLEDRIQNDFQDPTLANFLAAREGRMSGNTGKAAARMTFGRFFNRYNRLSAINPNLGYNKSELEEMYGFRCFEENPFLKLSQRRVYVAQNNELVQHRLDLIRQSSKPTLFIIDTENEDSANSLAYSISLVMHEVSEGYLGPEFDPAVHCLWINKQSNLGKELKSRHIKLSSYQTVILTEGILLSHALRLFESENYPIWIAKITEEDLNNILETWYCALLFHYSQSGFFGSETCARWLFKKALTKKCSKERELRKSLAELDEHYRDMISFVGI